MDLSKVTDVVSGREATGKNNSITLSTANGSVYLWLCQCTPSLLQILAASFVLSEGLRAAGHRCGSNLWSVHSHAVYA